MFEIGKHYAHNYDSSKWVCTAIGETKVLLKTRDGFEQSFFKTAYEHFKEYAEPAKEVCYVNLYRRSNGSVLLGRLVHETAREAALATAQVSPDAKNIARKKIVITEGEFDV